MLDKVSIFQIILGAIALLFLINGFLKFVRSERGQTYFKLLATLFIWGNIFVFSIFPNLTHTFSRKLGLGENLNTLIFIGFVVIFAILFKLLNIIEKLERNISEIVRKQALNNLKDKLEEK